MSIKTGRASYDFSKHPAWIINLKSHPVNRAHVRSVKLGVNTKELIDKEFADRMPKL